MLKELNELIYQVEHALKNKHVHSGNPQVAMDYYILLTGWLSTAYEQEEKHDKQQAEFYINHRGDKKSDLAVSKDWRVTKEGILQKFWETRISRIKVLREGLLVIYYAGREQAKASNPIM